MVISNTAIVGDLGCNLKLHIFLLLEFAAAAQLDKLPVLTLHLDL